MVRIDGSFFVPDADQALIGFAPGTIVAESSTTIIVTVPPGVAGPVAVLVQTPDCAANAGTSTYITPGQLGTPPTSFGFTGASRASRQWCGFRDDRDKALRQWDTN